MGWQPETQPKGKPPVEKTEGAETMQRLIDADALKNDILKSAVMIDDRGIQTGYEIAIELIKRQPTIDAEPQWIPVSERLPEEKGEYLVTYHPVYWDDVKDEIRVGIDTFRGRTTWAKKKHQRVIAWMPLPKPYEVENDEIH